MEGKRLSKEEIEKRLTRLRNLEVLYADLKTKYTKLKVENKDLKQQIILLTKIMEEQQATIQDLTLQVAELRTIVFGKKRKKKNDDDEDDGISPSQEEKKTRSKESYKRPLPNESEITEKKHHSVAECSCGKVLLKKETVVYYEEDIPLPIKKTITQHTVERGYCSSCKKWHSAIPLPFHKVVIGPVVRKFITILSVVNLNSYSQIETLLRDVFSYNVSQGEIAKILAKEADHLRPVYERLKESIRSGPVKNLDETSWPVAREDINGGNYAWTMTSPITNERVFLLGKNRGKGNLDDLLGKEGCPGFTVSDDYVAYDSRKKTGMHQLCFAHPNRKFKDLAKSDDLKGQSLLAAKDTYQKFATIYQELKTSRDIKRYNEVKERLTDVSEPNQNDPKKLIRLKKSLRKNIPSYLTFFKDERIPLDNNQAERSLRHLVLKRKVSFGSQNKDTAENLAILLSVVLSLKQTAKGNFFQEYLRV